MANETAQKTREETDDIQIPNLPALDWSQEGREESIRRLYSFAENAARHAIHWYWDKAGKKGWKGQALRLAAILLATAGGLIPLLVAAGLDHWLGLAANGGPSVQYSQWGYVLLALAGGCIALDKFFGFSSSWIRFVTTGTDLQTALTRFYIEWARIEAGFSADEQPSARTGALLQKCQELLLLVREKIRSETEQWATEYRGSLRELEGQVKAQLESQAPGGVDLTVTDGASADAGILVSIDGRVVQTMTGTQTSIRPIFPGQHSVSVATEVSGEPVEVSRLTNVGPGQIVALSLTLRPS